jgi:RNA polymerase sigma factor (sigma-70 family)
MAQAHAGAILRHIQCLFGTATNEARTDAVLLQRFALQREEGAFTTLVQRHGWMVWGVCRHVLQHEQDTEDAFQATFLVLARRAGSIRKSEAVGTWLHGVAYRIAQKARTMAAKRRACERRAEPRPAATEPEPGWRELQAILDEELRHLPQKYRAPFVLCCLEGRSRAEAATELGWKPGTLSSRIAKARDLLQQRLTKRGVTLSAALTAGVLWNQPASAALVQATQQAALRIATGQTISQVAGPTVTALAEYVLKTATWTKTRIAALLLFSASLFGGLATAVAHRPGQKPEQGTQLRKATSDEPRVDQYGDPLPPGAVARMGTIRLRHEGFSSAAVFTQDGKAVISAGVDGVVHMWDAATGKRLQRLSVKSPLGSLAISPDGKTIAVGDWRGEGIRLIDTASFKQVRFWKAHNGRDICVDFAPDGRSLLSAATTEDAEIIL